MLNLLRRLLGVRSPSMWGMTKEEWVECGKLMQEGFAEGIARTREIGAEFQIAFNQSIEDAMNSAEQSPPCEKSKLF